MVWLKAISVQFSDINLSFELEKAVKKNVYVSIKFEITVDKLGAIHHAL